MTALSIAEAESRSATYPQVSQVRRGGVRTGARLASVTGLSVVAGRRNGASPEISRSAGVSRSTGAAGRIGRPAAAGVSRAGFSRPDAVRPAGVRPGSARPAAAGPVRLTGRGRAVVAGLVAVVAVVAGLLLAAGGAAAASHGSPAAGYRGMRQVVVEPGETLWSIASAAEPAADPQSVIQQIVTANSLGSSTIHAGQVLWVPKD